MKKFINNIKRYFKYAVYSARADLKAEVAGSYLNWLWWVLDPRFFMLIYIFIAGIVFKKTELYFPVFIFTGLTVWDYFNRNINASVKIVSANRPIVTKIYIPKYILILQKSFVTFFKMLISWGLVIILMILWKVPLTPYILYFFPILLVLYVITFGFSLILMHFGIFIEDLGNVITLVLKLVFYLSGIFYNVSTSLPEPFNKILLNLNPVAFLINAFRDVLLYGKAPSLLLLSGWFLVGIFSMMIGIHIIHKYENSYAKVI